MVNKRSAILATTIDFLRENSVAKLRINRIAELVGVDSKLIYYHFDNKDKLLIEAFEHCVQQTLQPIIDNNEEDISVLMVKLSVSIKTNTSFFRNMVVYIITSGKPFSNNDRNFLWHLFKEVRTILKRSEMVKREDIKDTDVKLLFMVVISSLLFPALLEKDLAYLFDVSVNELHDNNALANLVSLMLK